MSVVTAEDLLRGPRGRRLCKAVAHQVHEDAYSTWPITVWNSGPAERDQLLAALADTDPAPISGWRDPLRFLEPMDESVGSAMYWQPPHEEDALLDAPTVVTALRPIAAAIAAAPAAAWWDSPVELVALRYTSLFDEGETPAAPALTGAVERLAAWRERTVAEETRAARDRPADPAAPITGTWWSTPAMTSLVTTTRPLPGLGSIALVWEEDSLAQRNAAVWSLRAIREPRVWEIDRPGAWQRLVEQYPLEVTHSRRHDWYDTTGRTGRWYIPDWHAVAADWDAVHLSVAGYLTTATRALPLAEPEAATVLAGWDPDQTWWLTDILTTTSAQPECWHEPDTPGSGFASAWQPAGG